MQVTIKGMEELFAEMDKFQMNIPQALANAGRVAMKPTILGPAKMMCPVDTGHLQTSIHTESNTTTTGAFVRTGTNYFYAVYVEFGTGKYAKNGGGRQTPWGYIYEGHKGKAGLRFTHGNKPQPFLTTAFELNKDRIPDLIARSLRMQIDNAVRKKRLAAVSEYLGGME